MLRLENITKDYVMKDSAVHALKGINLNFRKNEFVSILGPSGCGKTTLLNILGGLDHYTSGDLIIEGRSTKDFNDHDWDIYRNHRIGFVFQAYNLIPHENILENVELALTIGGVGKEEREKKAKEALDKVGLQGMYKKMPNQLSGGQCQRVAIARALVNEPEILLADEPTGALDSKTSVQIMDLIKEISKERLVIMVTHNPDLAYRYSTRIVKLLDGKLIDDSNPYSIEEENKEREEAIQETEKERAKKENEKAKMSWWTAFKLSIKNLLSKAKRTSLTVIAASIGIIGVSTVLSIRSGITDYIVSMQDEMLSGNPISVSTSSFDYSSILNQMGTSQKADIVKEAAKDGYINVDFITEQLINSAKTMGSTMIQNDISKDYIDYIDSMPREYYKDITKYYGIDVSNNIYTDEKRDDPSLEDDSRTEFIESYSLSGIRSIATAVLNTKLNQSGYGSYASMIESYAGTFAQSLSSPDYILEQYDLLKGQVAKNEDEIMIVLDSDDAVTDFMLTLLGYYSQEDFLNVVYHFNTDKDGNRDEHWNEQTEESYKQNRQFAIDSLMNKRFTYYPNDTIFKKNNSPLTSSMNPFKYSYIEDKNWANGIQLKVVGILKPKEGRQFCSLQSGFYYTPAFTKKYIQDNKDSELTKYIRDVKDTTSMKEKGTLSSGEVKLQGQTIKTGVYYSFDYKLEGTIYKNQTAYLGSSDSSLSSLLKMFLGGQSGSSVCTYTSRKAGGEELPVKIQFYPQSFAMKYLVTDYLDVWNDKEKSISINDSTLSGSSRKEIKYTDNLAIVIFMINNVINIISIALISFTALSLVVSTVMIAIITYVSVIERIKEIGVIRALGGRKKDVSHLFNAETLIIGFLSGLFGILVTYLIQIILNLIIHINFPIISSIASLPFYIALIIIFISILLTTIAGFIPARGAAKKDPVEALRSE